VPSHFNWSLPLRHLPRQSEEHHGQNSRRHDQGQNWALLAFQYGFYLSQLARLSHSSRASAKVSSLGTRITVVFCISQLARLSHSSRASASVSLLVSRIPVVFYISQLARFSHSSRASASVNSLGSPHSSFCPSQLAVCSQRLQLSIHFPFTKTVSHCPFCFFVTSSNRC